MWTQILIAILSAMGGGGLGSFLTARKKGKLMDSEVKTNEAKAEETAVNTLKTALKTLNEEVINPIKSENKQIHKELKDLTNEVQKFRKAIERIPACPHASHCPVTAELQNSEANS